METVDLNNVPLFSTGIWEGKGTEPGGMKFTESELDDIVKSYNEVGDHVKPRLILGHDKEKSNTFSGYPSLGWIKDLRRDGTKLVGDLKQVPKKIADMIDKKAYGRFSPGIWKRMNVNGKDHYKVLDHVGLLGATLPGNTDLDGFIDLYNYNDNNDDLIIYNKKVEVNMELKELQEKLEMLTGSITELQKEIEEKGKVNDELIKENGDLKANFEKAEFEKKETELKNYLESSAKEGKITPAQIPTFMALGLGSDEMTLYEHKDENDKIEKIEGDRIELVKKIVINSSQVTMTEESETGEPKKQTFGKKDEFDDEDLHNKAKAYVKKHDGVDYRDALVLVAGGAE